MTTIHRVLCSECGGLFEHPRSRGRYPQACPSCVEARTARLREERHARLAQERRSRELLQVVVRNAQGLDDPSREEVARAVLRLGRATGIDDTRNRALELAGSALAWALAIPEEEPVYDHRELAVT